MAVFMASHLTPGALRTDVTEGYVTQPMLTLDARSPSGRWAAMGVLNAEGATLRRGEIAPGMYGEGYVDRRHPHTWLHEAMAGVQSTVGQVRWSLFAGKGFVPFGTDDPMSRPMSKYPANHHLAQVVERAQLVAAIRWRSVALESARFGGDEPESPHDWPNRDRLLDSWSARATWWPRPSIEVSASSAAVRSPEFATGEGLDQRKRAGAIRLSRESGTWRYALVEGAHTGEYSGTRRAFVFRSLLGEAAWVRNGRTLALRAERTDRPEEERTRSPYRSIRPLLDFNVLGRSRWTNASLRLADRERRLGALTILPGLEGTLSRPRALDRPAALDPVQLFGASRLWSVSATLRLHGGTMRERFGRYGAATGDRVSS